MSYENLTRRIERSTREAEGRFYRYDRNHPNTQLGRDSRFPSGTNLPESNLRRPYQTILTGAGIAAGAAGMAGCTRESTAKKIELQKRLDEILNNVKERIGDAEAREAMQLQERIVELEKNPDYSGLAEFIYQDPYHPITPGGIVVFGAGVASLLAALTSIYFLGEHGFHSEVKELYGEVREYLRRRKHKGGQK